MDTYAFNYFRKKLETIEHMLIGLKTQGEKTMAQIDDLNAAIQAESVELSQLAAVVTKVDSDLDALAAAVAAGASPTDLTQQIAAIQSQTASLVTAVAQLSDTDTKDAPPSK